jgi:hypothetical protein
MIGLMNNLRNEGARRSLVECHHSCARRASPLIETQGHVDRGSASIVECPALPPPGEGFDVGPRLSPIVDLEDRWSRVSPRLPFELAKTALAPVPQSSGESSEAYESDAGLIRKFSTGGDHLDCSPSLSEMFGGAELADRLSGQLRLLDLR